MLLSAQHKQPLESVSVAGLTGAAISVRDGQGREYVREDLNGAVVFDWVVGGSLGSHVVAELDADGRILDTASFAVNCETHIEDESGRYHAFFNLLFDTMEQDWHKGYTKAFRLNGKRYKYYVSWLRDHVHCLKGMKYFDHDVKPGIEIYADSQREDGMIWDKCKEMLPGALQQWRDYEFAEGDFIRPMPGHPKRRWQRIPVENDVEFLFLEGIYYTWKACGDDAWMAGMLDKAIKAVKYSTSDKYRWSEKYQVLKRGFTIDTWDFQSKDDIGRSGSTMRVDIDKTEFNAFHGDNTGMAVSCRYLAEMLRVAGRAEEADAHDKIADELYERIEKLAWNGKFYTHMIPENQGVTRDLGNTDEASQISLSNAYGINRRIGEDKARAIIKSYQGIRDTMPKSSPGEFYNMYPPFDKGFGHNDWNYMNGGVSTICGGELSHGAFEHGEETYGASVLDRFIDLGEQLGGYLHCCFKGKLPEEPTRTNTPLEITSVFNADFHGAGADGVPGWTGDVENDMCKLPLGNQTFAGVEFQVIDPAENDRKACLGLSHADGYVSSATIDVNAVASSVYFLHAANGRGLVGWFKVNYSDGTHKTQYVNGGSEINGWFMPAEDDPNAGGNEGKKQTPLRVGWQGANNKFENVGMHVYGWNNPNPDKTITSIELTAADNGSKWMVAGLTLSDAPVFFEVSPISYGIPDMWGAAALMYAMVEGLAGIVDTSKAYETARIAPRWNAAKVGKAKACAKYPASNGYVSYVFEQQAECLKMNFATNATSTRVELLLPEEVSASALSLNGEAADFEVKTKGDSRYACFTVEGVKAHSLELSLEPAAVNA